MLKLDAGELTMLMLALGEYIPSAKCLPRERLSYEQLEKRIRKECNRQLQESVRAIVLKGEKAWNQQ